MPLGIRICDHPQVREALINRVFPNLVIRVFNSDPASDDRPRFEPGEDEVAPEVKRRRLAAPVAGDPTVVAGESGGAGLAGVLTALRDLALVERIRLGHKARVLVIVAKGATDPWLYEHYVGCSPEPFLAGQAA